MQRLLPPILFTALVIVMILASRSLGWPDAPGWLRACGLVVLVAGLALTLLNARLFGRIGTNIHTFNDPGKLVTTGAFGWTRNPMYLGFSLMLIGIALGLGTAVAWGAPAVFALAANTWYIPFEEQRMHATFGTDYEHYQSSVNRWFGRGRRQ